VKLGIFHVDVFPDGVRFEDVCAAISAAWLADNFDLAEQLAREYGLYDQVCLRCASRWIASSPHRPPPALIRLVGDRRAYQLCNDCAWYLSGPTRTTNPCGEISHLG